MIRSALFVLSFGLVAFGQPAWSHLLAILTAFCGYALFWKCLLNFDSRKKRFFLATVWFLGVQAIQFSWFANLEYHGTYILFIYVAVILWLGVQFGLLSLLFPVNKPLRLPRIGAIAAIWVFMEWSRLFVLCGFSWNHTGLALSANVYSSQLASIGGVFFLSFWVMFVNLLAVRALHFSKQKKAFAAWFGCGLLPYLLGAGKIHFQEDTAGYKRLDIALVQTGIRPDQKIPLLDRLEEFISPFDQWREVFHSLKSHDVETFDLIVLPEAAVPFSAYYAVYPYKTVHQLIERDLGIQEPELRKYLMQPFATQLMLSGQLEWVVTNAFFAQILADYYSAEVIVGFDHTEVKTGKNYNAAFHFAPNQFSIQSYGKRVLLPLAEYLPYEFLRPLVSKYGISEFFTQGKEAEVFQGKVPISVSICYDECFGHLVREGKLQGAKMLVNVTNDDWFPLSRLSKQHFGQGRMRAIENGLPVVRSCNTGGTAVIDSHGRVVDQFQDQYGAINWQKGALFTTLDVKTHPTLYSFWGNYFILSLSLTLLAIFALDEKKSYVIKSIALQ